MLVKQHITIGKTFMLCLPQAKLLRRQDFFPLKSCNYCQ